MRKLLGLLTLGFTMFAFTACGGDLCHNKQVQEKAKETYAIYSKELLSALGYDVYTVDQIIDMLDITKVVKSKKVGKNEQICTVVIEDVSGRKANYSFRVTDRNGHYKIDILDIVPIEK